MKAITLSADESLIDEARRRATEERTTLNARLWLASYVGRERRAARAETTLREVPSVISTGGRTFTRDDMNER